MDPDYSNPATVDAAVKEWGEVFRQLPRVDAVFVPGGDPGHTQPKYLMALLEKQTANLRKYHPGAGMWLSPQGFSASWMDEFFGLMDRHPAWLSGIVFGPQVRVNLPELRQRIPQQYPIRFYPDITHSINAEFPVTDWDVAYAQTEEREVINPRPLDEARIFRVLQPYAAEGFIAYSGRAAMTMSIRRSGARSAGTRMSTSPRCCAITADTSSARTWPTPSPKACSPSSATGAGRCSRELRCRHHARAISGVGDATHRRNRSAIGDSNKRSIGLTTTPTCEPG